MSSPVPTTEIPANWMHPDLRRQLTDRNRNRVAQRLEKIGFYRTAAEKRSKAVAERLDRKRAHAASLEAELAALRTELKELEERDNKLKQVVAGVNNQMFYQRTIVEGSGQLQRSNAGNGARNVSSADKSALPDLSAFIGTRSGYDGASFAHAAEDEDSSRCMLEVAFLNHMELIIAAPSCAHEEAEAEHIKAFLQRFAPLFGWNATLGCVPPPLLFDEPCLMELEVGSVPCSSAGCAYWHHDQLGHLKTAFARIADAADAVCTHDARLCGVRRLFAALGQFVLRGTAIDQLCCGVAYTLNRVISLGWHRVMLAAHHSGGEAGRPSPQSSPSPSRGWPAPVVAVQNNARHSSYESVEAMRIACVEERDAWEVATTAVRHGSTPADVFTADPTSLSWRCMTRMLGTDQVRRQWLSEKGRQLFPTSPHIQVAHVLSLMEEDSQASAKDCVAACLEAARLLSTQAAAASLALPEVTYGAVAARYVAFLVASCVVHTARTEPETAVALLKEILGTAPPPAGASTKEESETVSHHCANADEGGGYVLLPAAHQNLTLLLTTLERTGHLPGADALPLGAISDVPLAFTAAFPSEPDEATVTRLNAQLSLLNACQRDGMEVTLLDRLKAAAKLSLVRTFSQSIEFVEQILHKAAPHSEVTQTTLWLAYVHSLCFTDGFPSAPKVIEQLLEQTDGKASCLLTVLMLWYLQAHAQPSEACRAVIQKATDTFLERNKLSKDRDLFSDRPCPLGEAPVEWLACHILVAETAEDRWGTLARIPSTLAYGAANETEPALLLLFAEARAAAARGSTEDFRNTFERCLTFLTVAHRQWWSALDTWTERWVLGLPHWVALTVYRAVPFILGTRSEELTLPWRTVVLEVAGMLHVIHPILHGGEAS